MLSREAYVTSRMTAEEAARVGVVAALRGQSRSEYVRSAVVERLERDLTQLAQAAGIRQRGGAERCADRPNTPK